MWQTKYASAVHKNLGLGLNFRAVKAISSLGVRSRWACPLQLRRTNGNHRNKKEVSIDRPSNINHKVSSFPGLKITTNIF